MARRMIRARRASPYLLYLVIAFAVLTVACAVGWGWMYSKANQTELHVFGQVRIENAGGDTEGLWRTLLDTHSEDGPNLWDVIEKKTKVANEYRGEILRLSTRLTGDVFDTQHGTQLRQSVSDILKGTNDILVQTGQAVQESYAVGADTAAADVRPSHTVAAIRSLVQRIKALVSQIKQDASAIGDLQTQLKGVQDELATAKAEHARKQAQLQQNLDDEKVRLTTARDDAVQQTGQFKQMKQETDDRIVAEQTKANRDRDQLNRQISILTNQLKEMARVVEEFRRVPTETGVDGRIVNIAELGVVAYADLGKKDGVLLGMTFSVFSPNELGKTLPQPKAHCRIVKIMGDACELRIYELQGDDPVVIGDVLHNPVYDRQRRMRFMLIGKVDIDGDGVDDSEQLKALIQEFGGRVDTRLTVQTDYVVAGEEPAVPAPPPAGAAPQERADFESKRKDFIAYVEVKANAENFSIPVLSLNRFLGLVGIAGQG